MTIRVFWGKTLSTTGKVKEEKRRRKFIWPFRKKHVLMMHRQAGKEKEKCV